MRVAGETCCESSVYCLYSLMSEKHYFRLKRGGGLLLMLLQPPPQLLLLTCFRRIELALRSIVVTNGLAMLAQWPNSLWAYLMAQSSSSVILVRMQGAKPIHFIEPLVQTCFWKWITNRCHLNERIAWWCHQDERTLNHHSIPVACSLLEKLKPDSGLLQDNG